jgi:hypothetical protein
MRQLSGIRRILLRPRAGKYPKDVLIHILQSLGPMTIPVTRNQISTYSYIAFMIDCIILTHYSFLTLYSGFKYCSSFLHSRSILVPAQNFRDFSIFCLTCLNCSSAKCFSAAKWYAEMSKFWETIYSSKSYSALLFYTNSLLIICCLLDPQNLPSFLACFVF